MYDGSKLSLKKILIILAKIAKLANLIKFH